MARPACGKRNGGSRWDLRYATTETFDRFEKGDPVCLFDEGDSVSTNSATEAVERVSGRVDVEVRPTAVGMKRTPPDQSLPGPSKVDSVARHDLSDRSASFESVSVDVV